MKKVLFYCILVCFIPLKLFADVYSYSWAQNYRGYSIVQIPGVSPVEYIAAGTVYNDPSVGYHGFHFLHIDASGNILNSRKSVLPSSSTHKFSYRVVDVDAKSSTAFFVTIQVTDRAPGSDGDFILPLEFDVAGNIVSSGIYPIKIGLADSFKSVYPTNAIYYAGSLFICGYRADREISPGVIPPAPNNNITKKMGVVVRLDENASNCLTVGPSYTWNYPDNGLYDYDMPLKMAIDKSGGNLLVTGAMNTGTNPTDMSGILALHLDLNLNLLNTTGVYLPGGAVWGSPPPPQGLYGIDVYQHPTTGDVYLLSNYFRNNDVHRWGIALLKSNFTAPTPATFIGLNNSKTPFSWAKQFFPLDVASGSVDFAIIGESRDLNGCPTTPAGLLPSITNVNPFVANYNIVGNSTSGISSVTRNSEYIHQTTFGTKVNTSGFDYFTGGNAASLDDVRRLHTFATLNGSTIALMSPYFNRPQRAINPKLMLLSTAGAESVCTNQITDCDPGVFTSNLANGQSYLQYDTDWDFSFSVYDDVFNDFIAPINCSTGLYKTTSITTTTKGDGVKIYPTLASDVLNISLPGNFASTDRFNFELVNAEGKVVYQTATAKEGVSEVKINLPALASGLYFAKVKFNDISKVEKVNIQQ